MRGPIGRTARNYELSPSTTYTYPTGRLYNRPVLLCYVSTNRHKVCTKSIRHTVGRMCCMARVAQAQQD